MVPRPPSKASRLATALSINGEVQEKISTMEQWFLRTRLRAKNYTALLRAHQSPSSNGSTWVQVTRDSVVIFEAEGTKDLGSLKTSVDSEDGSWESLFGI